MKRIFFPLIFICAGLFSCDDKINPQLQPASPVYVVDAFINTNDGPQVIHITQSQSYFDDTLPPGVSGATVHVTNDIGTYDFEFTEDPAAKGDYKWSRQQGENWTVGAIYKLTVTVDGQTFTASSKLGRVPPIDSITFDPSDRPGEDKDFYRAQFWANDPLGVGDTYWIRAWKNGVLLNKPSEINVAYDAAFSKGSSFDGFTFIQPIRSGINPDDSNSNNSKLPSPYSPGDSVYVQILSLTEASFDYLNQVAVQTNRPGGFGELFARPLANVSTNMVNTTAGGTPVVGFFNVSTVSGLGKKFVK